MQQIILSEPVIDGITITIFGVNIICTETCCSLLQKNLAQIFCDFIILVILVDDICQVIWNRCVNIISIFTIFLDIVCTRFTLFSSKQRFRRTINNHRSGTVAIGQAGDRRRILESLLNSLHVAIRCVKACGLDRELCWRDACRIFEGFGCLTIIELVVIGQRIAELYRRVVVASDVVGDFATFVAGQCIGAGDFELIATVAVGAMESCRAEGFSRAINRRVERAACEAEFITRDGVLVDGDVAIAGERVIGVHIGRAIYNMNIAELKLICVRVGIGRLTIALAFCIFARRADGIFHFIRIELVIAVKARISSAIFCIDGFIIQRSNTIRLRRTAVEGYRTAVDFKIAIDVFRRAVAIFTLQIAADRDVINGFIVIICRTHAARAGSCCRCTGTFNIDRARVVVHDVAFLEGLRIVMNVDVFAVLAFERCRFRNRQVAVREFNTIRFFLVFSRNRQIWLYLEDVLVVIVLTCRIRSARRTPLCVRAAVEIRAKLIGIWRVGIDLPVAARTGLDGRDVCRGQVLERTACTLHIDDNSIVVLRIGVQRTVIMLFVQYDRAIRRGQVDVFMRRDAIDMDVARSLDVDAFSIRCNAVADCDVIARDADAFVRVDNTRVVLTAANRDIASVNLDILQGNRVTDVTSNVGFRIAGIDDEARMLQVLFLDETTDCPGTFLDIIPIGCRTEANRDDWAGVVRLSFCLPSILRIAIVPLDVVVVNGRAIVLGKFRAFSTISHAFWASDPIISVRMLWISRRSSDATAAATDDQLILLWRAGQRVLKSRRDRSEIRIARVVRALRRALSHCLGTVPSN